MKLSATSAWIAERLKKQKWNQDGWTGVLCIAEKALWSVYYVTQVFTVRKRDLCGASVFLKVKIKSKRRQSSLDLSGGISLMLTLSLALFITVRRRSFCLNTWLKLFICRHETLHIFVCAEICVRGHRYACVYSNLQSNVLMQHYQRCRVQCALCRRSTCSARLLALSSDISYSLIIWPWAASTPIQPKTLMGDNEPHSFPPLPTRHQAGTQ